MKRFLTGMTLVVAACGSPSRGLPDAGETGDRDADPPSSDAPQASLTAVYAHTAGELFRVDPDTLVVTSVGPFGFQGASDSITDIAIDRNGLLLGISFDKLYRIDPSTAATTFLAQLGGAFNGMSFVPAAQVGETGDDVLIAVSGPYVYRINPATGGAAQIGDVSPYSSSGDIVSVEGYGTVLTSPGDVLVRLAPGDFAPTPVGTSIGFSGVWGVAYWGSRLFGFTSGGQFITIDPNTGVGTLVQANGPSWWGAAVNTNAPVIL
ncbi:MAG: hypothetical protein ACTHU0_14275 [Kofleriaceae bacterium]